MSDLVVIEVTEQQKVEIVIPQPGTLPTVAGVASFNTRVGIVAPQAGDYSIGQIAGAATVASTGDYNDLINTPSLVFAPISHVGSTGVSEHGVATTSVAGFMSSSDKTKLDGIASGANAGITALTGEVTASGVGSVAATLDNASVIAKVLTGLNLIWRLPGASDSILDAIGKLTALSVIQSNQIDSNCTIPANHTMIRGKTIIGSGKKLTIDSGGRLKII